MSTPPAALLDSLRDLLGPKGFTRDPDAMAPWLTDWRGRFHGRAAALVAPANRDEVAQVVRLCGNHERFMLDFLGQFHIGGAWMANGGAATLHSYGIAMHRYLLDDRGLRRAQAELARALPPAHRDFLRGLALSHEEGDYLFVHAGIRPGIPLEDQSREDLLRIRHDFLGSERDHGVVVVHGHTAGFNPVVRDNRICLDTAAWSGGPLTCGVFEGDRVGFLQA